MGRLAKSQTLQLSHGVLEPVHFGTNLRTSFPIRHKLSKPVEKLASLHPWRGYLFDCDIKHLSCREPGKSPPDAQHRLQSPSDLQAPGPSDPAGTTRSSRC